MQDTIEKEIEINASLSKVWQALTDYRKFGSWFGVNLESPFEVGQVSEGQMTIPGYEQKRFEAEVVAIEPEHYFSYRWHPCCSDQPVDCSQEEPTLVEFRLTEVANGTLLKVVESGFSKLPPERRDEAFTMNTQGWTMQLGNIQQYAEA